MERSSDDEGATVDDRPPDDASDEGSEFVEVDPTGRYGRYDEVLGKGAYKTVYKAFDDLDGIEVAWNQVKIQDMLHNAGDMERLYSELHLLKTLKHKNIIKFYNSWVDTRCNNMNFITEIFTSGTLRQYRKKHKHVQLRAIKHWSRQIVQGLVYLHSHDPPVIHRDLKCDNIFINGNNGEVKIGDLGLAAILRQAPAAHSVIGTPEFMAPELYEEHYNELVDIYSFGMCLLEMLTLEYPYSECTNAAQIYKKVTAGKRPAALNKVKDPEICEFVEKCLASASQRLHARELLMDPFLRNDEDLETLESCQSMMLNPYEDLNGLDPVPEESHSRSAMFDSSPQVPEESHSRSAMFDSSPQEPEKVSESNQITLSEERWVTRPNANLSEKLHMLDSPSAKEGLKRSRDFRIKGRKQDDKKVLVRIRITSSRGGIRYIQFDFDVEADTAMSVASEMVTELDLSDQDVTTIADMIDAEIMALIPDWKPGLAFDEAGDDESTDEQRGSVLETLRVQEVKADEIPLLDNPCITLDPADDLEAASGPRNEVFMYGRFEEVGYNLTGSDHRQQEPDGLGFFSDFSSEHFEGGGSDLSLDASLDRSSIETRVTDIFATQIFEGVGANSKTKPSRLLDEKSSMLPHEGENGDLTDECLLFLVPEGNLDGDTGSEELRILILQQEQELQLLQSKHDQEILDLKMHLNKDSQTAINKLLREEPAPLDVTAGSVQSSTSPDGYQEHISNKGSLKTNHSEDKLEVSSRMQDISILDSTIVLAGSSTILDVSENAVLPGAGTKNMPSQAEKSSTLLMGIPEFIVVGSQDITVSEGCANALKANKMEELVDAVTLCNSNRMRRDKAAASGRFTQKESGYIGGDLKLALDGMIDTQITEIQADACPDLTNKNSTASHFSRVTTEPDGPETRVMGSHDGFKLERASLAKRESYLELYKAGSNQKEKLYNSKLSELGDGVSKFLNSKDNDQDQLKRQQLQKSIADLEAKTLEGLLQSKSKYLVTTAVKNYAGVTVQNGQPGSTAAHARAADNTRDHQSLI